MVSFSAYGSHIVGGEVYYDCLGNNIYQVTMKVYRDCSVVNAADFDQPALLGVFDAQGNTIDIDSVFYIDRDTLNAVPNNICYQAQAGVCVEQASYIFKVTLPPKTGGYDVVYSRCCRNSSVINILNPDQQGATNTVHIDPQLDPGGSSPRFDTFPPVVICADLPLVFNHAASDPDGDSLSYSFFTPFVGGSQNNPIPIPSPPPYGNVVWASPYGLTNLIGGTPFMTIDSNTGIINANPNIQGRFIVGVQVQAFKNEVLVSTVRRDFQFNVTPCQTMIAAKIPIISTVDTATTHTAGLFAVACDTFLVNFVNTSVNATICHWNFGDQTNPGDTSDAFQPGYVYPDTGIYVVTLIVDPGYFCADTTSVYVKVETCLGIEGINGSSQHLSIYPNPVQNITVVEWQPVNEPLQLSVTDLLGHEVSSFKADGMSGKIEMDISGLANGLYLVRLMSHSAARGSGKLAVVR